VSLIDLGPFMHRIVFTAADAETCLSHFAKRCDR